MKSTELTPFNKLILSVIAITLILLAQSKLMDAKGLTHTEAGLSRALVTYGISRGLNGVISVVQGTEVAIEPVGVGVTFTPGQILDPVNDLIERFSTIVLVSGTAFGVQRVFLEITASSAYTILLSISVITALLFLWLGKSNGLWLRPLIYKVAVVLLIVRFSVPLIAISSEHIYQTFLAPQFETSSAQLLVTTERLEKIQSENDTSLNQVNPSEKSFLDSARDLYESASNSLNMRQHLDDFKQAAESISEHALKLIVVFVFQTIIVPLLSAWLLFSAIKWVARYSPKASIEI